MAGRVEKKGVLRTEEQMCKGNSVQRGIGPLSEVWLSLCHNIMMEKDTEDSINCKDL